MSLGMFVQLQTLKEAGVERLLRLGDPNVRVDAKAVIFITRPVVRARTSLRVGIVCSFTTCAA